MRSTLLVPKFFSYTPYLLTRTDPPETTPKPIFASFGDSLNVSTIRAIIDTYKGAYNYTEYHSRFVAYDGYEYIERRKNASRSSQVRWMPATCSGGISIMFGSNPTVLTTLARGGLMAVAVIAGCSSMTPPPPQTLDGHAPLVIAHRGASGYLPENTLEAYKRAIDLGADAIELDLISTKDGALIASHYPNLAMTTDVASRPEFASRRRENWPIDGELQSGWFAHDFTLAEIETLFVIATDPERPQQYNGKFKMVTLQEVIDLVKAESERLERSIAIYPESKNPTYHRDLGLPLEDKLIRAIRSAGWNSKTAPVFVQSFEPGSLKEMRAKGLDVRMVQLIDADGYNFKTGDLTYTPPFHRPYDWEKSGDQRLFRDMVTPAALAEIKTYADGIGPWKPYIVPVKGQLDDAGNLKDINGDGNIDLRDAVTESPTSLIEDAHKLGLFVHAFTFRNESRYLAHSYSGDPHAEYLQFYRLGVDGVFSEFPETAIAAR